MTSPVPPDPVAGGDIFGLLVGKITDIALKWAEHVSNSLLDLFEPVLCALTWGGFCNVPPMCFSHNANVYRCEHAWGKESLKWLLGCGFRDDIPEEKRCFFDRQRSICIEGDPSRYNRYQDLFEAPSTEELENQFFDIVYATRDSNTACRSQSRVCRHTFSGVEASTLCPQHSPSPLTTSKRSLPTTFSPTPRKTSATPGSGTAWTLMKLLCACTVRTRPVNA